VDWQPAVPRVYLELHHPALGKRRTGYFEDNVALRGNDSMSARLRRMSREARAIAGNIRRTVAAPASASTIPLRLLRTLWRIESLL